MRRLVKRLLLPLLLLVGLALIGPQTAEAARWHRHARRAHIHHPYYVVRAPRVRVYAPGVSVHVGRGVHVRAPGVGVHIGSWYAPYYRGPHYYGW